MLIKHYFLAGKQMKRQEITQLMLLMLKNCEGRNEGQDRTTLQPIHHRYVKFGPSEKRTKFDKDLPYGFDKSADLLSKHQNHEE